MSRESTSRLGSPGPSADAPVLVVIDPQRIFADPASDWASPFFGAAMANIARLAAAVGPERTLVTRWLPTADRSTAWGDYFRAWPFADVPADDALYDLVDAAQGLSAHPAVDEPTFGKWGPALERAIRRAAAGKGAADGADGALAGAVTAGPGAPDAEAADRRAPLPPLLLTGVSTDCCVITTALAAADAGVRTTVVSDACAASTEENGAAAMQVMSLFPPQLSIATTDEVLAR